jgi:hypothetical protein
MPICRRAGEAEVGASDRERFELELEFLQCLANPQYLHCEWSGVWGSATISPDLL